MKRTICVILSMLLLLGVSACSAPKQEPKPTEGAPTAQPDAIADETKAAADETEAAADETEAAATEEAENLRYASWDEVSVNEYRQEEIEADLNGQKIPGIVLIPELEQERYPLVICCHELGDEYESCMDNAELMATHGIAACCFEFRGIGSNTEISFDDMSIMTEVEDTMAVVAAAGEWSFVDPDKIVLYGRSLGGAVAAIAAARCAEQVNGLVLCYAALSMPDKIRDQFSSLDDVPARFGLRGTTIMVGRAFAEDIFDYDILAEIGNYTKPVLILHGITDPITPLSYMEQAAESYPDAALYSFFAGHGFNETRWEEANAELLKYLQKINMIEAD